MDLKAELEQLKEDGLVHEIKETDEPNLYGIILEELTDMDKIFTHFEDDDDVLVTFGPYGDLVLKHIQK